MSTLALAIEGVDAESCYWCGPAAEQVHRSRRPPPCRAPYDALHSGRCDTAQHCATIAVSPPYVESRICVGHHQEECSTRFCNRSQTWRVTCTCRGALCNGETDPRVLEALARMINVTVPTPEAGAETPRSKASDPPPELIMKVTDTSALVDGTSGATHEYHNAHEMSSLWTTSSESETVEQLPSAAPLKGGAGGGEGGGGESGGGEDDEDAGEGSGAALRSDHHSETVRPSTERSVRRATDAPLEHHASGATVAAAAITVWLTSLTAIFSIV